MWILIVIIIVAGTIAAGASLLWDKDKPIPVSGDCKTCSGVNPECEQVCMIEASVKEIEYFDDEELDAFKGRESKDYTIEEAEEFRQIMESLSKEDLKAWNRSLILRGINLPDEVKDEYILLSGNE